jgi:hypothetical protein
MKVNESLIQEYGKKLPVEALGKLSLKKGSHDRRRDGVCAMEAAAWLAGREHSDAPPCVSPVLKRFVIAWNDGLPSDEDRNRLLLPVLPELLGTAGDGRDERREWMATDWLIRVFTPTFLELHPDVRSHAAALRDLEEVGTSAALAAALPPLKAAWPAAWAAAWPAAWPAAWDAAWPAAQAAAWAAARAAAWAAAQAAAWAAARAAAWAAAQAAAASSGVVDFSPTVRALQESASTLLRRMIAGE